MKLERKQPVKPPSERAADVLAALGRLSWMPKYPADSEHIAMIARLIAKFCDTGEVNCSTVDPMDPDSKPRHDWGWVNPLDWLIDRVAESCVYFPPPIRWRQIYTDGTPFWPLDGINPERLTGGE